MYKKIVFSLILTFLMALSGLSYGDSRAQAIYKRILKSGVKKGKAIAKTADEMDIGFKDQQSIMRMVLIDASGGKTTRIMATKRLEQKSDGDKSVFIFKKPNDIKGIGLLTFEHKRKSDEQWLYLPASGRLKKISSDNKSGSFQGSEFSYEDLGTTEIEKYRYKYQEDGKFDGQDCFILIRYPTERSSGYSKQVSWVRKDNFQPLKVEYYDRKNEHLKTLLFKRYKKLKGKYWRAYYMDMENVQTGKRTTLTMINLRIGTGLSKDRFTTRALKRS